MFRTPRVEEASNKFSSVNSSATKVEVKVGVKAPTVVPVGFSNFDKSTKTTKDWSTTEKVIVTHELLLENAGGSFDATVPAAFATFHFDAQMLPEPGVCSW